MWNVCHLQMVFLANCYAKLPAFCLQWQALVKNHILSKIYHLRRLDVKCLECWMNSSPYFINCIEYWKWRGESQDLPVYAIWHPWLRRSRRTTWKTEMCRLKYMFATHRLTPANPSCQVLSNPLAAVKDLHSSTQHEHHFFWGRTLIERLVNRSEIS